MKYKAKVKDLVDKLQKAGAHKAVCSLVDSEKKELNVESDKITLFRTTFNTGISLTAYVNNKKGAMSINKLDKDSIDKAVKQTVELAESSKEDPANQIAETQVPAEFKTGIDSPDLDLMYSRLIEFMKETKSRYPKTILKNIVFNFTKSISYFMNSNGVDYVSTNGRYNFSTAFTTKDGKKSSSMNYTGFISNEVDKPLIEYGSINTLLQHSAEQLAPENLSDKFTGDIIITPDCAGDIISFLTTNISTYSMITELSVYKDKLNKKIASEKLTLHSRPHSNELVNNYFITGDGYPAEDITIVEKGILKTFLLSLYGAVKTGKERALNSGGCYIIEKGEKSFGNMIKSIKKGLLVCRLSGGRPGNNGDFSGVAKNSYYIKDGKIQFPVTETMISGNVVEMLNNITAVSNERINDGSSVLPWIQFSNISISGK